MIRGVANDPAERIADGLERLALLIGDGADLSRKRLVTHSFSGHADQIEQVAVAMRHSGYTVTDEGRSLEASAQTLVDEAWLREAMIILCRVADRFEVTYDGFEVQSDLGAS
jgi:Regulator of ribonuclease activity B